jgi:uncharacterized protein (TIGR02646 family)
MIKVTRDSLPPAIKVFITKNVRALDGLTAVTRSEQELEKAVAFFTNPANYANETKLTKNKFSFTVYKDPDLAAALETMFCNKCAYCESRFGHVTPKDVEHFRPKSEIDSGAGILRPGYFWLASDWENLFVSCPDCNRARKHVVPGQAAKVKLGKETQFPLSDETRRMRNQGKLLDEEPVRLLLNPCVDLPEDHLAFDDDGLIHARLDTSGVPSPKGMISITVYALQRKSLVEERLRVLNQLRFQFAQLSYLVGMHNRLLDPGDLTANADQIRSVRDELRKMLHPDAPYLAMLRGWIRSARTSGEFDPGSCDLLAPVNR